MEDVEENTNIKKVIDKYKEANGIETYYSPERLFFEISKNDAFFKNSNNDKELNIIVYNKRGSWMSATSEFEINESEDAFLYLPDYFNNIDIETIVKEIIGLKHPSEAAQENEKIEKDFEEIRSSMGM